MVRKKLEVRSQKSEVRSQNRPRLRRAEVRIQESEVRNHNESGFNYPFLE
ncbi:MAG: hypothetical protein QNJ49_03365 [Mastigocoleus sp. MO_167.B18]|nr:hypothetical protein [Mastigocoleus sp. MO_167.B18]